MHAWCIQGTVNFLRVQVGLALTLYLSVKPHPVSIICYYSVNKSDLSAFKVQYSHYCLHDVIIQWAGIMGKPVLKKASITDEDNPRETYRSGMRGLND